ncbi:type II toxin-antitoxin system VapC family toxin [Rhizobium leguminosarum]
MKAVIDTSVLLYFLNENTPAPIDPATSETVTHCKARIDHLLKELERTKETLIVPTPVLAEVLVRAGAAGPAYLQILEKEKTMVIADFGKRAAVEAGAMLSEIWRSGNKPSGGDARAKLKFDVMIAAIAKANSATQVYSDDPDLKKLGATFGFAATGVCDLPLPPENPQGSLPLTSPRRALDLDENAAPS